MKKFALAATASLAALSLPSIANAQEAEVFVGVSGGYHDLGVDGEIEDEFPGVGIDDGSPIFGAYAGVDVPLGESLFAGVEGNYHIGTSAIDSEYGASLRLGFQDQGGAKYYLRGGYQEVNFDYAEIIDLEVPAGTYDGLDDTDGDYLVGAGAEFPLGTNAMLRVNVDTIAFDSARATAGIGFRF
ncbi:outer membrane beta-barrel protein [Erythrobacter alti]|uniref:outer membrane beta-barrel protein n=1 Tax=Erythrobacter alti TaxID=1896145 RepID=UPI0030F3EEA4